MASATSHNTKSTASCPLQSNTEDILNNTDDNLASPNSQAAEPAQGSPQHDEDTPKPYNSDLRLDILNNATLLTMLKAWENDVQSKGVEDLVETHPYLNGLMDELTKRGIAHDDSVLTGAQEYDEDIPQPYNPDLRLDILKNGTLFVMLRAWNVFVRSSAGRLFETHPYIEGVMAELEKRGIVDADRFLVVELDQLDRDFVRGVEDGWSS